MHAQFHALFGMLGNTEQFHAVAKLLSVFNVRLLQLGDALGISLAKFHRHAKSNRRHNRQLVRGVDAFHVKRRISLGIAQALRFANHVLIGQAFFAHFGQNKVSRTVDNAGNPLDFIRAQAFA